VALAMRAAPTTGGGLADCDDGAAVGVAAGVGVGEAVGEGDGVGEAVGVGVGSGGVGGATVHIGFKRSKPPPLM
jgi:hypothetical protein